MNDRKKIVVAVNTINDAFVVPKNNDVEFICIKTSDMNEWVKHPEHFFQKTFGDSLSNISLNFIYKKNDQDFSPKNLSKLILEYKKKLLLKKIIE